MFRLSRGLAGDPSGRRSHLQPSLGRRQWWRSSALHLGWRFCSIFSSRMELPSALLLWLRPTSASSYIGGDGADLHAVTTSCCALSVGTLCLLASQQVSARSAAFCTRMHAASGAGESTTGSYASHRNPHRSQRDQLLILSQRPNPQLEPPERSWSLQEAVNDQTSPSEPLGKSEKYLPSGLWIDRPARLPTSQAVSGGP